MASYETLAGSYDALTGDVPYEKWADFMEKLWRRSKRKVRTVLDLACGTGSLTWILTRRGYELISVDGSEEMLCAAREKGAGVEGIEPLFLHQDMTELDLYDTVDAAVCCLDSINYLLYPSDVKRMLKRLHLFVSPGGMLIFDINTPYKLKNLDNQVFLDEQEDVYCVWRTEYEKRSRIVTYGMDIFQRRSDGAWERSGEEHYERAHTVEELTLWLQEAGFCDIRTYGELKMRAPREDEQRIFFSCINSDH